MRWVEVLDALDVASGLAAAAIVEARVGFRPVGSDVKPLLGLVDGLVIATVSARPAGPSARSPRLLADVVLGYEPLLDTAPFDPLRRAPPGPWTAPLR